MRHPVVTLAVNSVRLKINYILFEFPYSTLQRETRPCAYCHYFDVLFATKYHKSNQKFLKIEHINLRLAAQMEDWVHCK